jgi:hypothetical protein
MRSPLSDPLLGFHSPSESSRPSSRRQCRGIPTAIAAPPLRSLPLQRLPAQRSDFMLTPASVSVGTFRFSQPPGAFLRPVPAGHLSDQIRSWGFPLQSFSPLAKPCTISSTLALLPLGPPPRSHIQARRNPMRLTPLGQHYDPDLRKTEQKAPTSEPYSARESDAIADGLDRRRHVALLGFLPSRVFPLAEMARPSPPLPSWACRLHRRRQTQRPSGSHLSTRLACLLRDCRPSWGL